MTQLYYCWEYTQNTVCPITEILVCPCSLLLYICQQGNTTNLEVSHQMNKKMKIRFIYTVEFFPSVKESEIMNFAGKWVDLERTMLGNVSQTQKEKLCILYHIQILACNIYIHRYVCMSVSECVRACVRAKAKTWKRN